MSNNINRIRKNKLKGTGIFAAAALTAALIAGNNMPGVTRQVSAAESQENTVSSLIPDNITLDKPVELADVELPATEYGTLNGQMEVSFLHSVYRAVRYFLYRQKGRI